MTRSKPEAEGLDGALEYLRKVAGAKAPSPKSAKPTRPLRGPRPDPEVDAAMEYLKGKSQSSSGWSLGFGKERAADGPGSPKGPVPDIMRGIRLPEHLSKDSSGDSRSQAQPSSSPAVRCRAAFEPPKGKAGPVYDIGTGAQRQGAKAWAEAGRARPEYTQGMRLPPETNEAATSSGLPPQAPRSQQQQDGHRVGSSLSTLAATGHHSQSFHRSPEPGTRSPASFHRSPDPVTRSPASFHRSPVPLAAAERSQPSFHRAAGVVGTPAATPASGCRSIVRATSRSPSPTTARVTPLQSRAGMTTSLQHAQSDYILSASSAQRTPALANQQHQQPAVQKEQCPDQKHDQKQDQKQLQQKQEPAVLPPTIWWPPKSDAGGEQQQQQPQTSASSTIWSPPAEGAGQSTSQLETPAMISREPPSRCMRTSSGPPLGGSAGQTRGASPGATQPGLTVRQLPLETSQVQALSTTARELQLGEQQKPPMFWHAPACATAAQPQPTQRQHFPSWTPSPLLQGQQATRPAAPLSWTPSPMSTEASKVSPSNAKTSTMAHAVLGSASPFGRRFAVS